MGLTLYSLGAIFFWPTAHFTTPNNKLASYGGFLACTFVIACGLSTLETSANSYAVIIGDPASASIRLQFCQSWNGVASFVGPLIASKFFFSGANAGNLTNVQYVYLAVACLGAAVAVLFVFTKLPEVSEQTLADNANIEVLAIDEEGNQIGQGSIWKQYNMFFAFGAQFAYVGAQVTIGAFFINYVVESGGYDKPQASNFLSYALIIFTVGRFVAVCIAFFLAPSFIMCVYSALAITLTGVASGVKGSGGVGVLMAVYFLMAPMYPTIFTLGTASKPNPRKYCIISFIQSNLGFRSRDPYAPWRRYPGDGRSSLSTISYPDMTALNDIPGTITLKSFQKWRLLTLLRF